MSFFASPPSQDCGAFSSKAVVIMFTQKNTGNELIIGDDKFNLRNIESIELGSDGFPFKHEELVNDDSFSLFVRNESNQMVSQWNIECENMDSRDMWVYQLLSMATSSSSP